MQSRSQRRLEQDFGENSLGGEVRVSRMRELCLPGNRIDGRGPGSVRRGTNRLQFLIDQRY